MASSVSTIASFIAGAAMVVGTWNACLPSLGATDAEITRMLKGVEDRYNHTKSLQVAFAETYIRNGRKLTENGELYLRKPGHMRWEYKIPTGKMFGSDGKYIYSFLPDKNLFEKSSMKGAEDMRAPLAFLLGNMHFESDFRDFKTQPEGRGSTFITALPKSDKLPYTQVMFLVDPNFTIRWLNVKGVDGSQLEWAFSAEKQNPVIEESKFQFKAPLGVIYSDTSKP